MVLPTENRLGCDGAKALGNICIVEAAKFGERDYTPAGGAWPPTSDRQTTFDSREKFPCNLKDFSKRRLRVRILYAQPRSQVAVGRLATGEKMKRRARGGRRSVLRYAPPKAPR